MLHITFGRIAGLGDMRCSSPLHLASAPPDGVKSRL
jgi:hypothetical protein